MTRPGWGAGRGVATKAALVMRAALVISAAGLAGCGPGHSAGAAGSATTVAPPTTVAPTTFPPTSVAPTPPTTARPGAATLPATASSGPAAPLYRRALADGQAKGWVHGVTTSPAGAGAGAATTIISDDGPDQGTQTITVGTVAGEIRVLRGATYLRGSAVALITLFQVPPAAAAAVSNRWVRLRPTDSVYATVTAGVSISSFLQELALTGRVTQTAAKLAGAPVTVIKGALAAPAGPGLGALDISDGALPLPLVWQDARNAVTITFSAWGRAVPVAAPAGAITLPAQPSGTITVGMTRPE